MIIPKPVPKTMSLKAKISSATITMITMSAIMMLRILEAAPTPNK